jgi:DNA polymerase
MPRVQKSEPRSAADFLPADRSLAALRGAAAECRGCDLYERATQTVFGEGPRHAKIVFVGEQPGDQEDLAGKPFVGPAGRVLDEALREAGIPRAETYVTNAVKHFKWEPMGKRRKHKRPSAAEMAACRPWLQAEVDALHADIVVCLGATAAQSVFGRAVRLGDVRGRFAPTALSPNTFATVHPSAILRSPDREQQKAEYARFVDELRQVAKRLATRP